MVPWWTEREEARRRREKYGLTDERRVGMMEKSRDKEARPIVRQDALFRLAKEKHERSVPDRKSTRLNSSHIQKSRMPSSA